MMSCAIADTNARGWSNRATATNISGKAGDEGDPPGAAATASTISARRPNENSMSYTVDRCGGRATGRKLLTEFPDGEKHHFEGDCGAERLVRVEYRDGDEEFYSGPCGEERMVRTVRGW